MRSSKEFAFWLFSHAFSHIYLAAQNVSSIVGPKIQDFCPRIDMLKGNCFKTILLNYGLSKSAEILLSKSNFYIKTSNDFFKNFIFWTTLFSKIMTNWCSMYSQNQAQNTMVSYEYIDFWQKILLYRTCHL